MAPGSLSEPQLKNLCNEAKRTTAEMDSDCKENPEQSRYIIRKPTTNDNGRTGFQRI